MHPDETRLNDYVDGVLSAHEAAELDRHIADCATCAYEVERLRELKADLAQLPLSITPDRDLRKDIWSRIEAEDARTHIPARTRFHTRTLLAAAAVLLVVASSAITLLLTRRNAETVTITHSGNTRLVSTDARAVERQYSGQVEELQAILKKSRGTLAPETIRILEQNLAIIDSAINEARTALASDPNSGILIDLLRSAYERKLELLRQAAKSSST